MDEASKAIANNLYWSSVGYWILVGGLIGDIEAAWASLPADAVIVQIGVRDPIEMQEELRERREKLEHGER